MQFVQSIRSIIVTLKNKIDMSTNRSINVASSFLAIDDYLADLPDVDVEGIAHIIVDEDERQQVFDQLMLSVEAQDPLHGDALLSNLNLTTEHIVDSINAVSTSDTVTFNISGQDVINFSASTGELNVMPEYTSNGVKAKLENIAADLSASIDLNTVVSSALEIASNMKTKSALAYSDVINYTTQFTNVVNNKVGNLKGDALTYYQIFLDNIKQGPLGMLTAMKNLYKSSKSIRATSTGFEFTDNSQYGVLSNLWGAIKSVLSVIADVVAEILAWVGKIFGAIVYGIYMLGKGIISLFNTGLDAATYATIKDNEPDYYCFQPALYQHTVTSSSDIAYLEGHYPELVQWGSCLLNTPWGPTIIYRDISDEEHVKYKIEAHAAANIKINNWTWFDSTVVDITGTSPNFTYQFEFTEWSNKNSFYVIWDHCLGVTGDHGCDYTVVADDASPSDIDTFMRESYLAAMHIFLTCCFTAAARTMGGTFTLDPTGSHQGQTYSQLSYLNAVMTETIYPGTHVDPNGTKWADFFNANKMNDHLVNINESTLMSVLLNFPVMLSTLREQLEVLQTSASWEEDVSFEYIEPFSSLGTAYVATPKVDRTYAISALIATAVGAAIAAAVIAVTAIKVTKARNAKRATLKVAAEKAWDNLKANPTAENYKTYRKAAKRNNRFVKRFGGSALATSGYWDATSSTSEVSTADSNLNATSLLENPVTANILNKIPGLEDVTGSQYSVSALDKLLTYIKGDYETPVESE